MPIDESEWSLSAQALRVYIARRVSAPYVDDLVGEILLRMADGGSGFSAAAKPMAWMYRVASNLISDHYRRQAIEQRIFSSAESQPGGDSGSEEEEASAEKELALCLLPLIKALPELYREALQLVDIEGQTQVLAARQLAISLAAMKSRVRRGRQQLKQHLLACCRVEINRGGLVSYESKSDCC
ncbi:MAG: sigma-70 family RNA polymerase sigma factor [Porticoccaceae bacterium]|nr:sigma-70 family RNA polymerase sigma factor [Porticoccaceae bacterium]